MMVLPPLLSDLGKLIAEGGTGLRFSPRYPRKIIQLSNPELAVKSTQKYFYALDMNPDKFVPSPDDKINLMKLDIQDAEPDGTLKMAASVYDHENNMIRDGSDQSREENYYIFQYIDS